MAGWRTFAHHFGFNVTQLGRIPVLDEDSAADRTNIVLRFFVRRGCGRTQRAHKAEGFLFLEKSARIRGKLGRNDDLGKNFADCFGEGEVEWAIDDNDSAKGR